MANMRRVAPAMKRLQERYANDREKLSKEMMALYQRRVLIPWELLTHALLPMPVFLALYWVLLESVELRQAPFIFWINDLASMDPYFILPLLMGASTYLMQALNPQVGDHASSYNEAYAYYVHGIVFVFPRGSRLVLAH